MILPSSRSTSPERTIRNIIGDSPTVSSGRFFTTVLTWRNSRADLSGYLRVNDNFARQLDKVLGPDDLVWVHDYHLLPLAKALRERGHKNRIGPISYLKLYGRAPVRTNYKLVT